MLLYHLYLFADGDILVRQGFLAENDDIASGIAAIVADGCSDQCEKFELWEGARIVLNHISLRAQEIIERVLKTAERTMARIENPDTSLKALQTSLETSAAVLLESAMSVDGSLSRSEKLHARLAEIRKNPH